MPPATSLHKHAAERWQQFLIQVIFYTDQLYDDPVHACEQSDGAWQYDCSLQNILRFPRTCCEPATQPHSLRVPRQEGEVGFVQCSDQPTEVFSSSCSVKGYVIGPYMDSNCCTRSKYYY